MKIFPRFIAVLILATLLTTSTTAVAESGRTCGSLFESGFETRINSVRSPSVSVIENFVEVSKDIYRGGRPRDGKAFDELRDRGIKTVIDLQGGDLKSPIFGWIAGILEFGENSAWIEYEKDAVELLGIRFSNVPINSLDPLDATQGYDLGRAIALMKDPSNYPIYVHCEHGIDRTGMFVALYRVFVQGWKRQAAYDEMVSAGHGIFRQIFTGDVDKFFWAVTAGQP